MTSADDVPEYPSPGITDSRRLMGANLYSTSAGAVLEVRCDDSRTATLIAAWHMAVQRLVNSLGWAEGERIARPEAGGASLFLAGAVDLLMTCTAVSEHAWALAASGGVASDALVVELRQLAASEQASQPTLARVHRAAMQRNCCVTYDDDVCSLGSGIGGRGWTLDELPPDDEVPWESVHDVPIALVTGSNGKTTTTRLVAAMWRRAGKVPGWCCSDGVWVGDERQESGDYSGPAGARAVLRDRSVEAAVLETARGGMLRRGLAVSRADAAIITNVSADHFGEYGIATERELADVKFVVSRVLAPSATLVLNAGDAQLAALAAGVACAVSWFSMDPDHAVFARLVEQGGDVATVRDHRMLVRLRGAWHDVGSELDMPVTLRGAAPHNVQNALGAVLLAAACGVPIGAIRDALSAFGAAAGDNPGRLQVARLGGVTVITDYAHNPDGLASLCETARMLPAHRRILVLGQAGNRDDDQLRALVRAAWAVLVFDDVVIKEMPELLRGRPAGEIPGVFRNELARLGLAPDRTHIAVSEFAAAQCALSLATAGDLVVCPLHSEQATVLSWFQRLTDASWSAGSPFPDPVRS